MEGEKVDKKERARKRWKILAKALKQNGAIIRQEFERISPFMLLRTHQLWRSEERTWYKFTIEINTIEFSLDICQIQHSFSPKELIGFNNTGNVCIWPSEELLTYYSCTNLHLFRNKKILELGGGMSCLAGLFIAKFGAPLLVRLTDGNDLSVKNVQTILAHNTFPCTVDTQVLKWGPVKNEKYDVILCADCLFFDEGRSDLIECIQSCLDRNGFALVMAPERGGTLSDFIEKSQKNGFSCEKYVNYNDFVWGKRLELLSGCEFIENVHYPVLVKMFKVAF